MVECYAAITEGAPVPNQALDWLMHFPGGAVHVVVTRAKPPGLVAEPRIAKPALEAKCLRAVDNLPLHGIVVLHASGRIGPGQPLLVVGAAADHRAEAFEAVQRLMTAMRGVSQRRDVLA